MKLATLLAALCISSIAYGKPLYVTVPRAFSPDEAPTLDVSFAGREAVELRVLKPADFDKFVTEQANLRRAYVAPTTQLNPGRYLSKGLNWIDNPAVFLMAHLDGALRKELAPSLPQPEGTGAGVMSRLREGPEKLVSLPPGMTLVRSEWLNLDLGGDDKDFSVPGFESWGGSSGYQERHVTLAPLPEGVYVLQIVQGTVEGQVTLVVTNHTVQVKQTDGRVLVRVAGRDQKPVAGAKVQVYLPGSKGPSAQTDKDGEAMLDVKEPKMLVTVGSAVVDTDFYSALAITPDVFIYSDRPIYRPGDEVSFRGIVRKPSSFWAELFKPKRKTVMISMLADKTEVKGKADVDEMGSFSGVLKIPTGVPTGLVRLTATLDAQEHQAEARVQDYVKPTFYLELKSEQDSVKPGEKIRATVKARKYAGGAPKAKYEVFLYRTQLDTPSWVDDAGKGGQGSAVTYGSASTTENKLSVPKRLYSSIAVRMEGAAYEADPWATAPSFDKKGEATIEVDVPPLEAGEETEIFRYSLTVKARDDQKAEAVASKAFIVSDHEVAAQVAPSTRVAKKGAEIGLAVRSATLGGKAYPEASGHLTLLLRDGSGREKTLKEEDLKTDAAGVYRTKVPTSDVGTVVARVRLQDKNGAADENEATVLVLGDSGEAVAQTPVLVTESLSSTLGPGETAELAALFPQGWGPGGANKGPVWLTLSGSTIFQTQRLDVSGQTLVHKFEIEKRFGSVVYASVAYPTGSGRWDERSAAFRIVPKERVLTVHVEGEKAEVQPLTEQVVRLRVTDHNGVGVAAQVSLGVVDKAIYALQSELRPSVVDFFYPVGRNNVSNFYSMDFQGYGYGEQLAKLRLGMKPYEFAAVKAPTRRAKDLDRDTAYWNPAITTGADGSARVAFTMPSNQTLWVATAVAADAMGRFGEATSEFASRGQINVSVAVPQFLREGDEAMGSVRIALGTGKAGNVKVDVASVSQTVALAKDDEKLIAFKIPGGVLTTTVTAQETLRDVKEVAMRPAALEETVRVSAWGGGELALPAAADRIVGVPELQLVPSSVDAALTGLEDLLTYPYGCLEQLVATTVPNIALYYLLEKKAVLTRLDPDSQALLQAARSRSVQGIDRILHLAQSGGGFTWFNGYTQVSLPLTLIALDGLAYAIDAGVVDRNDPAITSSVAWLADQKDVPLPFDATRAYVLARLEGGKQAARVRQIVDAVQPTNDLFALAMAALAGQAAGIANEPGFKDKLAAVVAKSKTLEATWEPTDAFYSYPLRRVGMAAIASHARSLTEPDVKDARVRFVKAIGEPELSTFDRSTLLLHNLWLIEKDAESMRAMTAPSVDGVKLRPRGFGLGGNLAKGATSVKVGAFDGVATLEARIATPLASVKPASEGMSIKRTYYLLREQGRQKLEHVRAGDEVYVELEFNADDKNRAQRSAYYVVEDAVPAGFIVLQEDKTYEAAPFGLPLRPEALRQRAFTPEKATFFFEEPAFWSGKTHVVGYVMRAQFTGRFQAPPARIQDMYATKVFGRTAADTLTIE